MKYDDKYINEFRDLAEELQLHGREVLHNLSNQQIRECINGVGSEAMPSILRKALDKLHPSLVIASHIHDCAWTHDCNGSEADFHRTNEDFQENGIIMAKHLHAWYSPMRYLAIHKAKQFRKILDEYGWPAYTVAWTK